MRPTLSTYGGALLAAAYAGMLADLNQSDIENYPNIGATGIDFGVAVGRKVGDADQTCRQITVDADIPVGISVRHATMEYDSTLSTGKALYQPNQEVPVLRKGFIWCTANENVVRDSPCLSITAANGALGCVATGAAGAGRVAFPAKYVASWETTTTATNLGLVRIVS